MDNAFWMYAVNDYKQNFLFAFKYKLTESASDRQSSAQVLSLHLHPGDKVLSDVKSLILETKKIISKAQT